VSDGKNGDARSDHADDARKVPAKDMRELSKPELPSPKPHLVIGYVDAGRVDVNYHFPKASRRVRRIAVAHHLRPGMVYQ